MKKKRFYAVEVYDRTCNDLSHEFGAYGRGDYSWAKGSLNGGAGEYNMTKKEALEVKDEFERYIEEHSLDWAAVDIGFIELPVDE